MEEQNPSKPGVAGSRSVEEQKRIEDQILKKILQRKYQEGYKQVQLLDQLDKAPVPKRILQQEEVKDKKITIDQQRAEQKEKEDIISLLIFKHRSVENKKLRQMIGEVSF
jgi:hypothetical protein